METILTLPEFILTISLVFGLCVGSFLNVVAWRLPKMLNNSWQQQAAQYLQLSPPEHERLSLSVPASHCPACQHRIRPWHNLPVLGWLLLRGRCFDCQARIAVRYPLVELATGLLSLATVWHLGASPESLWYLPLVWSLVVLFLIDFDHQLLPDSITLPLLWLGLLVSLLGHSVPLEQAVIGAMLGYGSLWSVYWAFKLLTGKDGMGFGDFKLFAALGAWFGWQALPMIILLSALAGAVIGLILSRVRQGQPMAFGPFLCVAAGIHLFFGDAIMSWYLGQL